MPHDGLDQLLSAYGIRLNWQQSHLCPCVYGGQQAGTPDPSCLTCKGYGWYWDAPSAIFFGLITFAHLSPSPDEPGAIMDEKFGQIVRAEPTLTIPYTAGNTWTNASINDIFTEIDTADRFNAQLQVGGIQTVPYQQGLNIPASGAVTVYDQTTHAIEVVSGYVVSGATVTLPSGYATGTSYIVQYTAQKAYAAWREAGSMVHPRPFGQEQLPRRFRLQQLDQWLRGSGKI